MSTKESMLEECGKMKVLLLPEMMVNAAVQVYLLWSFINTSLNILPTATALAAISLYPIDSHITTPSQPN